MPQSGRVLLVACKLLAYALKRLQWSPSLPQTFSITVARNPYQIWLIRAGFVLLALCLIFGAYWLGQIQAGYDRFDSLNQIAQLHRAVHRLRHTQLHLRQEVIRDRELIHLNALTHEATLTRLTRLEGRLLTLRERLDFYRGLVVPARATHTLRIQGLAIIRSGVGRFLYRLVLITTHRMQHPISGQVELTVVGEDQGHHEVLSLRDLAPGSQDPLPFDFHSYEDLVGHLRLPAGFKPKAVHIAILVMGDARPVLSQTFDWPIFLS